MTEHKDDRQTSGSEKSKHTGKPSFAGTSIAADEQEQTAARRAEPRTTDESGETTTAAVPPKEPKDATGDLTRQ